MEDQGRTASGSSAAFPGAAGGERLALDIRGLGKFYKSKGAAPLRALSGVDLQLKRGEIVGFLGPNGAGKSTTIKILTGQIRASEGTARILGVPATDPQSRIYSGYLPENPAFYQFMTGREYLCFTGRAHGLRKNAVTERAAEVLALLELAAAADRPIRGYSKGMVQRLGLAQALLHDPDVLILDEPMSGLDPIGRALVKDIIRQLGQRGKTVFFSTHITADIEAVCHRVAVIVRGVLRSVDSVRDLLAGGFNDYRIETSSPDGRQEEIVTGASSLEGTIRSLLDSGRSISRIEPRQQSLEKYFLQIVSGAEQHDG